MTFCVVLYQPWFYIYHDGYKPRHFCSIIVIINLFWVAVIRNHVILCDIIANICLF